jgi:hypothetical protein
MSCERGVCRLVKTKLSQTGTQEDWRFLLLKGESTIGHESNGCVSFWEILVSAQAITCASSVSHVAFIQALPHSCLLFPTSLEK